LPGGGLCSWKLELLTDGSSVCAGLPKKPTIKPKI